MDCGCNNLPSCQCLPCQDARNFDLKDCTDRGGTMPPPFPIPCTPPPVDVSDETATLIYINGEVVWVAE